VATSSVTCTPTSAGTFSITGTVTDSIGFTAMSQTLSLTVYTDPAVASFGASPANIVRSASTTFTTAATGGKTPLTYSYLGLPAGCSSANVSVFTCTPSATGTFTIEVIIHDANGFEITRYATLTVSVEMPGPNAAGGYALIGGGLALVAAVLAVATLLVMRRRKGRGPAGAVPPARMP
jgi:large repetitive protein